MFLNLTDLFFYLLNLINLNIMNEYIFYAIVIFFFTIYLSLFLLKKYLLVVKKYNLYKGYNKMSVFKTNIYTGTGILFSFVLLIGKIVLDGISMFDFEDLNTIIISSILVSIIGIYDDFMDISSFHKYIILLFIIVMAINSNANTNNSIVDNLNGFLGIYDIPYSISLFFTSFFYITIIYIINLLNDIDIYQMLFCFLIFIVFGIIFLETNNKALSLICLLLIAILSVFIRNNLYNKTKINIGAAGSLFFGFWIASFLVTFINLNRYEITFNTLPVKTENISILAFAIINIPVLDTFRVMLIRVLNGGSLFAKDKNHIHHIFIDKEFSHINTSILLCLINLLNLVIIYFFEALFNSLELSLLFIGINIFWFITLEIINKKLFFK